MKIKDTGEGIQIYDFSTVETLKIARKLEKEGIRFYETLLEQTKDTTVKEVFRYLLNEETDHLRLFEKLLEREDPEALDDDGEDMLDSVEDGVLCFHRMMIGLQILIQPSSWESILRRDLWPSIWRW